MSTHMHKILSFNGPSLHQKISEKQRKHPVAASKQPVTMEKIIIDEIPYNKKFYHPLIK